VTICIGLLAQDGIVIAADAQESDSYFKRSAQKIMTWHTFGLSGGNSSHPAACLIAGAGDGGFIDAFTMEFLAGVRGEMTMSEFEKYAAKKIESFYSTHVLPLLTVSQDVDFGVLIGAHFQYMTRLYKSYRTSFHHVAAAATAIGIGAQFALQTIDRFPFSDVAHTEITAAAVISATKDCIEGCGKYTDIVSIHNPRVPDEVHSSRLQPPERPITRVASRKIARWEESFSSAWRGQQTALYQQLIEEELKQSTSQASEDREPET
jgi:hypothetical protein